MARVCARRSSADFGTFAAAVCVQVLCWVCNVAEKLPTSMAEALAPSLPAEAMLFGVVDPQDTSARLHKERAATVIQSKARGHGARRVLQSELGQRTARHKSNLNLGAAGTPYLYVQTRHVLELEALLPPALGVENAKASYFEPTDCYTIRHATEAPVNLAEPALSPHQLPL